MRAATRAAGVGGGEGAEGGARMGGRVSVGRDGGALAEARDESKLGVTEGQEEASCSSAGGAASDVAG